MFLIGRVGTEPLTERILYCSVCSLISQRTCGCLIFITYILRDCKQRVHMYYYRVLAVDRNEINQSCVIFGPWNFHPVGILDFEFPLFVQRVISVGLLYKRNNAPN